ncbi:DMT family transporter [Amycolatopsis acidiphila]|uniref:DMT family transporter n=1 Tax=Amycolatopsis acidiphila TaxID=715473 RepID=A0A558A4F0_9PSEU|nr:DMT family transporter [Amycolatopsis acidiphila]TVT19130.1 DMT family transporter [Amycolatopsis acidiphila]UIJ58952.1 DMT family transporter [Amycolatopsis acidiphila]GHG72986.1 membrane protein [Amycolatopsis acidiphila]
MWTMLLGTGFVVLWSSGFVGATLGATSATAITLLAWRFLVAAGLLLAWHRPKRGSLALHAGLGLLSQGGYLFGVYEATELGVAAGTSALIAALQPIVSAVLAERVTPRQWTGLGAGLAGVAVVVAGDLSGHPGTPWWAYLLPFGGMLALVAASMIERRTRPDLADSLVVQCATSAVLFTGLAAVTGTLTPPASGTFWLAIACVVVLSTFGGYGCYWLLLRRTSLTTVSSLLYLTPPTTMLLAWLLFGQDITVRALLGLGICVVGVALVLVPGKMSVPRGMMTTCSSPTSSPPPRSSPPRARARRKSRRSPS